MPQYRQQTFRNSGDIDRFFSQFGATGYVEWFNKKASGKSGWVDHNGSPIRISKNGAINWQKVWNNITILYGKDVINLVEFLCLNSIMTNETGGSFAPISEGVGRKSNPGISYAFDRIPDLKLSYNTLNTNKKAYDLFRDSVFISAHGTKPFADRLKNTSDTRWSGEKFPIGFSGKGVESETDATGKSNGFIYEADFMKFRGRGLIQTTGRSGYIPLINFILKYNGPDSVLNSYKSKWLPIGTPDKIATTSTSSDWDNLFLNTNSIIANYAVYIHASNGGAKGKNGIFYTHINAGTKDSILADSIKRVAYCVAGGGATDYANLFYGRVMFILNTLEGTQAGPVTSEPASLTNPPEGSPNPSQTEGQDAQNDTGGGQPFTDAAQGSVSRQEIVNVFEPTIKPGEIRFKLPSDQNLQNEFVKTLGLVPFVWYNAVQISPGYIKYFELGSNSNNLPQIKLVFQDEFGFLKDKGFPLDDTKITIFINPRSDQIKPIHMDFKIVQFNILNGICTLMGIIDVNELMLKKYTSLGKKTSFNALQEIAKTSGLGFSTNISDTTDEMLWMQNGKRTIEFIEDISRHGYISDQTFVFEYVDFHYNLTYVDVEKEIRKDITNELGVANTGIENLAQLDKKELVGKPVLTNDASMVNSPGYFDSYRILNNSTNVSLSSGYVSKMKVYDEVQKKFIIFNVDGLTENPNSSIIMKGSPQDETFFNQNANLLYKGKLDDNVHQNYQYAETQNSRNFSELSKIGLEITLKTPNYNFYRFKKVKLLISNQAATPTQDVLNNRLSGFWIIVDIRYVLNDKKYQQVMRLVKRELELSSEEASKEPPQQSPAETNVPVQNNPVGLTATDGVISPTASGTASTGPQPLNQNPTPPPNFYGTQSAPPLDPPGSEDFPMTKEIFKKIYQKYSVPDVILEKYYKPLRNKMIEFDMKTKERITTFIVLVNQNSSYLKNVTENSDGAKYENISGFGNTNPGDGYKFRPRGIIKLNPGKSSYTAAGKILKKDFLTDPNKVAADNQSQSKGTMTDEQIENSILVALKVWTDQFSSWGDLRFLSDPIKIDTPLKYGNYKNEDLPNTNDLKKISTQVYEELNLFVTKNNNFATKFAPGDQKALNFLLIHFAINGSYDGFKDNVIAWNEIRELLK